MIRHLVPLIESKIQCLQAPLAGNRRQWRHDDYAPFPRSAGAGPASAAGDRSTTKSASSPFPACASSYSFDSAFNPDGDPCWRAGLPRTASAALPPERPQAIAVHRVRLGRPDTRGDAYRVQRDQANA